MQTSKFVLGFQAQLYTENSWEKYIIMIYISLVIYVTLANMTTGECVLVDVSSYLFCNVINFIACIRVKISKHCVVVLS